MLRLNTAMPPTAGASRTAWARRCFVAACSVDNPGGDPAGFPNGRRPGDDVVDIALRVVMGYLLPTADAPSGQLAFTDAALQEDAQFDDAFPYLRTPLARRGHGGGLLSAERSTAMKRVMVPWSRWRSPPDGRLRRGRRRTEAVAARQRHAGDDGDARAGRRGRGQRPLHPASELGACHGDEGGDDGNGMPDTVDDKVGIVDTDDPAAFDDFVPPRPEPELHILRPAPPLPRGGAVCFLPHQRTSRAGTFRPCRGSSRPRIAPAAVPASDDGALCAAVAGGDRSALGQLYDRHAPMLTALGLRILGNRAEAEDVLHDVFLEAWHHAREFDPARGTRARLAGHPHALALPGPALQRLPPGPPGRRPCRARSRPTAASRARGSTASACTCRCAGLPARAGAVIELAYFDGLSSSEIAERLRIPIGTVKSRMARALSTLRQGLAAPGGPS